MDTFLTVSDVAQRLKLSAESIRAYERAGKLKASRTASGIRLFKLVDVENFVRDREAKRQEQRA